MVENMCYLMTYAGVSSTLQELVIHSPNILQLLAWVKQNYHPSMYYYVKLLTNITSISLETCKKGYKQKVVRCS